GAEPGTIGGSFCARFHQIGNSGGAEALLDEGESVIDAAVHRAEALAVRLEAKRAGANPLDGVDGVDDFKDGEGTRVALEGESPLAAALSREDAGLGEGLEDLDKVAGGGARALGDLAHLLGLAGPLGEPENCSKAV